MADVASVRPAIEATGTPLAFVHGALPEEADPWFARFGLGDTLRVSDPTCAHYRAFGLARTDARALLDPMVWARGAVCAVSHGFGVQPAHLMRQLPGVFLVHGNRILASYRHRTPADRPNYLELVRGRVAGVTMTRPEKKPVSPF